MANFTEDCVFCKIISGAIPCHRVYKDDYFLAFLDISPAAAGHTVVISKTHASGLMDLPDEYGARFMTAVKSAAKGVMKASGAASFNLLQNNGPEAGQSVFHFHAHILPRSEGDGVLRLWNPGPTNHEELAAMAARVREYVSQ